MDPLDINNIDNLDITLKCNHIFRYTVKDIIDPSLSKYITIQISEFVMDDPEIIYCNKSDSNDRNQVIIRGFKNVLSVLSKLANITNSRLQKSKKLQYLDLDGI